MVYLFLADGFEEIEALIPLDLLRRADIPVRTVGIGTEYPCGAHGISVIADLVDEQVNFSDMTALILPGGMPGTLNLEKSAVVQTALKQATRDCLPIAAICAAPSILGHAGYLSGRKATCYPGFQDALFDATYIDQSVVTDGNIITAKGAGVALEFSLELIKRLSSQDRVNEIRSAIQCR